MNYRQVLIFLITLPLLITPSVFAKPVSTPQGYRGLVVFAGENRYRSDVDTIYLDDESLEFQYKIMRRNRDEIQQHKTKAAKYFKERFGLDVEDTERLQLRPYKIDPRANLKAYAISGKKLPKKGITVKSGGWFLEVIAPQGLLLGGEMAGLQVAEGTFFLYGDHRVGIRHQHRKTESKVTTENVTFHSPYIQYFSQYPMHFGNYGETAIRSVNEHKELGDGYTIGQVQVSRDVQGFLNSSIRMTMTFSRFSIEL